MLFFVFERLRVRWNTVFVHGPLINVPLFVSSDTAKNTDGNVEAGSFYADGQHLTAKGYDLLTDIIDPWLNSL